MPLLSNSRVDEDSADANDRSERCDELEPDQRSDTKDNPERDADDHQRDENRIPLCLHRASLNPRVRARGVFRRGERGGLRRPGCSW